MKKIISIFVVISVFLAFLYADSLAAGNSAENMYDEGMEFFEQKDYDRAFARFQVSGEVRGYAPSQNMLGVCYRDGLGTERDLEKAEEYFSLSAAQDYAPAQENLASLSSENIPVAAAEPAQASTSVSAQEKEVVIPWAEIVKVGDVVEFGSYEQDNDLTNGTEAIEWIVLDVQDGKAMLVSEYALDCLPDNQWSSDDSWEEYALRPWLNHVFFNKAFSDREKNQLLFTDMKAEIKNDASILPGTGEDDLVFLLSFQEVNKYLDTENRQCDATAYAVYRGAYVSDNKNSTIWWLRDHRNRIGQGGTTDLPVLPGVRPGARLLSQTAVRPAVWVSLEVLPDRAEIQRCSSGSAQDYSPDFSWMENVKTGDYVTFGKYEQDGNYTNGAEPVEWLVLDVQDDKALLLSRYALTSQKFTGSAETATWDACELRQWLNVIFLNDAFVSEEENRILLSFVPADRNPSFDTNPGADTEDRIFLLSNAEVKKYFMSDDARSCQGTEYAYSQGVRKYVDDCWWWLRTPGSYSGQISAVVSNGSVDGNGMKFNSYQVGIRPAMWISLEITE